MLEQFHFLEPLWFLALIPLVFILWATFQANTDSKSWEKVVDPKLLPLLLQGEDKNNNLFPRLLLAIAWIISVIALADPVWEKVARPIFQTNAARVIVLDLSNSMLIDDLKPSRLARARFKIEDILSREEEGQTGLVLFAGEAFVAAPLTRDTETIRSMLKVLSPQIMPAQGSRADLGLAKAYELLKQAGVTNGQILLIADGVSQQSFGVNIARQLQKSGHTVSVMAVGTEAGGKLNFRNKTSVNVKLESESLIEIAKNGGGNYRLITTNNSDLKSLLSPISNSNALNNLNNNEDDLQNREWKSTGPYLVLILLPFAALAFRRGWLLNIFLAIGVFGTISQPNNAFAAEKDATNTLNNIIEVLTKNKSQRIDDAFKNKKYKKALNLSDEPLIKGSAEYKLENYEGALEAFKQAQGADARYNEGNTLAKLEKYKEAIAAYDQALKIEPKMKDASDNKKMIQDFLKKQQQSKKDNQSSNENQQGNSDAQNDQQEQQNSDSNQNQDKKEGTQSAQDDSDGSQNEDQDKQDETENQFSEANQDIEKNKEEAEKEQLESATKHTEDTEEKQNQANQQTAKEQKESEEPLDSDIQKQLSEKQQLAEELSNEEKMAAEQWLRRIPDDPGGLLKRKFRHQYNQTRRNRSSSEQPW